MYVKRKLVNKTDKTQEKYLGELTQTHKEVSMSVETKVSYSILRTCKKLRISQQKQVYSSNQGNRFLLVKYVFRALNCLV